MAGPLPLQLSVKRRTWRKDDQGIESADREFREKRPGILERDRNTCRYCGFKSGKTEVHHLNDDHTDNRDDNLVTADPLCHGCNHIGQVGAQSHGVLAYVPGLSQIDLNHLQRTIFMMMEMGTEEQKREAQDLLMLLAAKRHDFEAAWGTSKPREIATALAQVDPETFSQRGTFFANVALIYNPARFKGYTAAWADEAYRALPPSSWGLIHARYSGNRAGAQT